MSFSFAKLKRGLAERRIGGLLILGVSILLIIVLISVIGPLFVNPHNAQVGAVLPRRPPSAQFFLGTDSQGRDMLTLLIYGTPNTLKMGLIAGFIGVGLGLVFGLLAGNFGGIVDAVIRIIADALLTVPAIAILVIIAGSVDRMTTNIMALIVASLSWMFTTRTIRAQVLSIRERSYVEVARVNGEGPFEILFREIMPNLLPFIVARRVAIMAAPRAPWRRA